MHALSTRSPALRWRPLRGPQQPAMQIHLSALHLRSLWCHPIRPSSRSPDIVWSSACLACSTPRSAATDIRISGMSIGCLSTAFDVPRAKQVNRYRLVWTSFGGVAEPKIRLVIVNRRLIKAGRLTVHLIVTSRGQWGTFCHFFQNWLWCTYFQELVFHTFLVSGNYIPYSKSFKCPIDVSVASHLVSTLESVICRWVIWQNLPHERGSFCHQQGHILWAMGHILFITVRHSVPWNVLF